MKFLFFDIECARCFKHGNGVICEFGYVLTDEKFKVLKKEVFLIAPEVSFQKYVIENVLGFTADEYNSSPVFKERYESIKSLLEDEDTVVLGHTTDIDAHYLNFSSRRYELPFINFDFYDVKAMYMHLKKVRKGTSLENIIKSLNLEFEGRFHTSADDAYATMLVFKELCRTQQKDGSTLLAEYAPFKGNTTDGKIKRAKVPPIVLTEEEKEEAWRVKLEKYAEKNVFDKHNFFVLLQLRDGDVHGEISESCLNGKSVCIDKDYQYTHFKEMLSLIQLIKRHGGSYVPSASACDIYVTVPDDGAGQVSVGLRIARRNKACKIIKFDKLLNILNATEDDLRNMPFPPKSEFKAIRKNEAPASEQGVAAASAENNDGEG